MASVIQLKSRRRLRSVHLYQSRHDQRRYIANLRYADGHVESLEIQDEREAIALAVMWQEMGAAVTLAWIEPDDLSVDGPEAG